MLQHRAPGLKGSLKVCCYITLLTNLLLGSISIFDYRDNRDGRRRDTLSFFLFLFFFSLSHMRTCVNKHTTTVLTSNLEVNITTVYCRFAKCSRCIFFLYIETRAEADGLAKKLEQLETALMTVIWHTIFDRYNANKCQSSESQHRPFDCCETISITDNICESNVRDFDDMEIKAKGFVDNLEYIRKWGSA